MSESLTRLEAKEIEQLTSGQLVELLHRLLFCEARKLGVGKPGILVPAQINVPDGGQDGRWNADIEPHDYIPRSLTLYQCKAEHIDAAMCRKEMTITKKAVRKKGSASPAALLVKDRVREALSEGGCYAFFCSKQEIESSRATSLNSIARGQLAKAGFTPHKDACVEFLGCNRIADWVNKFPAAIHYVRQVTKGFGGVHFYTMEGWGKLGSVSGPFFGNEAVGRKIASIREALLGDATRIIRLNGLSGVGKSRLVYEALRSHHDADIGQESLSASSVYVSYADIPADLIGFVSHLADNEYSGIIVIDDCPPDIHSRIANIVYRSPLRIITIFHEPEPSWSNSLLLGLDPSEMEDVVERMLREDRQLVGRGEEAIKAVAGFARGFAQFAKLITEFHRAPTLQELRDREPFFQKLLSRGEDPGADTVAAMQALAMFSKIGGSAGKLQSDLEAIRSLFCPKLDENEFWRIIEEQKSRKVIQQIADTLMLNLRPLAVALAADYIQRLPIGKWKITVDAIAQAGLLEAFASRLGELEFSDKGEEIGKLILEEGLPFSSAEYLLTGTTGSQMFRALSLLNPSAAIKVAWRSLGGCSLEKLHEAKQSRRDLVRALEWLSWESAEFGDAAKLLLRLAAAENESWSNNATGSFKQLFNLYLSGTKSPAIERLEIIRFALQSAEPNARSIAIQALGAGLNFQHFMRMSDASISGKRDHAQDWQPANRRQELDYWKECYTILRKLIVEGAPTAGEAKLVLGRNLGVILQTPLVQELEVDFRELCESLGHLWPEAKDQIKGVLEYHQETPPAHRQALQRWVSYLTPPSAALGDRIQDMVSTPGWHHRKAENGDYVDLSREEAERLASELTEQGISLLPYLRQLLTDEQQQGFAFGARIGKRQSRLNETLNAALEMWPGIDTNRRNSSVLRGFLFSIEPGSELRTEILNRVAVDENLIDLLVPLTAATPIMEIADLIRIREAFDANRLDVSALRHLIPGQPMAGLPDDDVKTEFTGILQSKPEAAPFILEILGVHCHGEPGKWEKYEDLIKKLLLQSEIPLLGGHSGWEWQEAAKSIIATTKDKQWVKKLAEHICKTLLINETLVGLDSLSAVISELIGKLPTEVWHVFGQAISSGSRLQRHILMESLGRPGISFEETSSPIWRLPEGEFRSWISQNRELVPLILENISLYTVQKAEDGAEHFEWHPFSILLMEQGNDEKQLERSLVANLSSFGSVGSRVPYLEKRLALVRGLEDNAAPKLQRIARTVRDWLQEETERTKREELNESAFFQ